jgi:hypothetical protein
MAKFMTDISVPSDGLPKVQGWGELDQVLFKLV